MKKTSTEGFAMKNLVLTRVGGDRHISKLLFTALLLALFFLPKIARATVCTYTATVNENSGMNALILGATQSGQDADQCTNFDPLATNSTPQSSLKGTWTSTPNSGPPLFDNEIFYTPNPGATGPDTFTITDPNDPTITLSVTITINAVASPPTATQSIPTILLTQNHTATSFTPVTGSGGTTPLAYSVSPSLPASLSMSTTTGAITGTATVSRSATSYTVTVTDANSLTATANFTLTVNSVVVATQVIPSTALTQNHARTSFTPVMGSGGTTPLAFSVSPSLPTGLSLDPTTGAITGTPSVTSSATNYTVTVTDANSATATNSFSLTVNSAVTATQAVASTAMTRNHVATSFTPVTGSGGTTPLAYSVSPSLPTGLSLNPVTGAVSGTPIVQSSTTPYTVTVTDANNATATATFSLTVNGPVVATQAIASTTLTQSHAATSFTPVTGSGGTTPLSFTISPSLPAGLNMASGTGAITGTPAVTSSATPYTVTVTDANNTTATATFSLAVNSAVVATQAVASTTLTVNQPTTSLTPVTGSGGTGSLTYSVSPSLPAGLSMAAGTGAITGSSTAATGAITYTVTVTDTNSAAATATFILTVNAAVVASQAVPSTALTVNHPATSFTPVTGSGGTTPLAYSVSPTLPAGLSMASGVGAITGTPTATSSATTYTVTVTDANNTTATATFSLTVNSVPVATQSVASSVLTVNHATTPFTPVSGSNGTGSLTYSISPALPAGLSLSSSTGAVTGTPTAASLATTYTVTVTDINGATATATFSLTVNGPLLATQAVPSTSLVQDQVSSTFTPVTGSGGTAPLTYSISPSLPNGLGLTSSNGLISGTPTVASSATTYTVTVTDANSATATATFTLSVLVPVSTVSSLNPASGPASGGTSVVITGTNFTGATAVEFGSSNATGIIVNSNTQITATAPAGTAGVTDVTVTTASGTSATTASDRFTYLAAPVLTTTGSTTAFTASSSGPSSPVTVDSGITVIDASATTIPSGTISITGNFHGSEDVLAFTNSSASLYGNITASYNATTGVLTLTSAGAFATVTQWQQALRAITYIDLSATPNTAVRTITFNVNDGIQASNPATKTVSVAAFTSVSALVNPLDVAADGTGNLYVADAGLSYIVKVPVGCTSVSCETKVGSGLVQPVGVAVDGSGSVYVTSGGASGSVVKMPWNATNNSYDAQLTVVSGLNLDTASPASVAVDGSGNIYLTDTLNQNVVKVPLIANTYGTQRTLLTSSSGLIAPSGVAVDSSGNLYVADASAHNLLKVAADGTQTTLASGVNSTSVAVDGSGDVYYSDKNANTITKLPWSGTAFGSPVTLATGLSTPYGLTVDESGNVYVANNTPRTVVKVTVTTPSGLIFADTKVGATSTDSPQAVTLANIGNAALSFEPTAGTNPSLTAGFVLDNATTCPQISASSGAQTLGQGLSCNFAVAFEPTSTNIGSNSGTLVVTDNDLNAAGLGFATQAISISGTGIADDVSSVAVAINPASPVTFGRAVSITASVTDTTATSTSATGNITLTDTDGNGHTTIISSGVALSGGSANISSYAPASLGSHTITAAYSGAVGSIAQSSGSATLVVNKATPILAYAPATTTQAYGAAIVAASLNATATDTNGAALAGNFVYTTTVNGITTTLVAGSTILPTGTYTITGTFTPSDATDYIAGGTTMAGYTVTSATATVALSNLNQVYTGSPLPVTATTTPANLTVGITYNGSTATPTAVGSYAVVAAISGSGYTGTAAGTLVIAKAVPVVMLASSANPVPVQNAVLLTATVFFPGGVPTGTVNFLDGTTLLGSSTLSNGVATLTTSSLTTGAHTITAIYLGDSNFASLASPALTENVQGIDLNITTSTGSTTSQTAAPGGIATYTLIISPVGGTTFPAAVNFAVSGLPAGATATFTPPTLAAGSGTTNVSLSVQLPQQTATLSPSRELGRGLAPVALGMLLMPFAGKMRRTSKRLGRLACMLLLLMAGAAALTGLTGCGSQNGLFAQPQHTYNLTVTGTSGALSHSTTVTLTVE